MSHLEDKKMNMENTDKHADYEQIEKDLNAKILKITMTIKDNHPELSKYLEEMPDTVPSDSDPEITLNHLRTYYESLNSLLGKFVTSSSGTP
jgi:hypothetical protein